MQTPQAAQGIEIQRRVTLSPEYTLAFDPEEYIILVMGQTIEKPAVRFSHGNVLACRPKVFEFKHSNRRGRKWWTGKPGMEFYLALLKTNMRFVAKPGWSYPEFLINGKSIHLNVSGGGSPWVDRISRVSCTCLNYPLRTLRMVAEASLSVPECKNRGVTLALEIEDPGNAARLLAAGLPNGFNRLSE